MTTLCPDNALYFLLFLHLHMSGSERWSSKFKGWVPSPYYKLGKHLYILYTHLTSSIYIYTAYKFSEGCILPGRPQEGASVIVKLCPLYDIKMVCIGKVTPFRVKPAIPFSTSLSTGVQPAFLQELPLLVLHTSIYLDYLNPFCSP